MKTENLNETKRLPIEEIDFLDEDIILSDESASIYGGVGAGDEGIGFGCDCGCQILT